MASYIKDSLQRAFQALKGNAGSSSAQEDPEASAWILGRRYYPELSKQEDDKFRQDVYSRIYFSYRFDFIPIPGSSMTTDSGWGCMHRSGQMLLAQWLSLMYLGRDWAIDPATISGSTLHPKKSVPKWKVYSKLLGHFTEGRIGQTDTVSLPLFSIQRIAMTGTSFHKDIGQWFGPSTLSLIFKALIQPTSSLFQNVQVVVPPIDGGQPSLSLQRLVSFQAPVLLFIPLRLGVRTIHPVYIDALKLALQSPYCLGIAGGKSNSSFYCIGYQQDHLICLDPHRLQLSFTDPLHEFASCHTLDSLKVPISDADPSLMIGFFLPDVEACHAFYQHHQSLQPTGCIYHIHSNDPSPSIQSTRDINSLDDLAVDETIFSPE